MVKQECMNCTIGQILCTHLLDKDQEHWSDYVAVTEMAINSTINASINKAPFEVLYSENIPLPIDLLFLENPLSTLMLIYFC